MKGSRSDFPASAGGFALDKDVAKVERELAAGHNVIIDTENLSEVGALILELTLKNLVWFQRCVS